MVLVAILMAALNLRIGIVSVGPVIEDIRADTGMSSGLAGLLTLIPFLCMGLFALLGVPVLLRLGPRIVVTWSLVLIGAGTLLRPALQSAWWVLLCTFPIGVGIALAGVALPSVVKSHFPDRGGTATGGYVAALSVGAAVAALLALPMADELGSWRWALALVGLPALIALPVWMVAPVSQRGTAPVVGPQASGALRSVGLRKGMLLALLFAGQSICYAGMITWIAAIYLAEGWNPAAAGLATASIPILTIVAGLALPALTERRDRRPWIAAAATAQAVALVGIAVAPDAAAWLWLTVFGLGIGGSFALILTLPLDLGADRREVAGLSGWTLGGGFMISAAAPVWFGLLRDMSDGFTLPVLFLAGSAAATTTLTTLVPRRTRLPPPPQP